MTAQAPGLGAAPRPGAGAWLMGIRPKTLTAALSPILVGTALAWSYEGRLERWELSLFALLSSVFIQIGTNLFNDAQDFKRGADTAERIGPRRVTQSGLLTPDQVTLGAWAAFALAAACALPLLAAGGWPILAIGLLSLVAGYLYTGGPFPLAYHGLGDLFVLIFFGWVAVSGMYYVHSGAFDLGALLAGTQVGLLSTVMIAINNLRDHAGDRRAGKLTLPARFGVLFGKLEITALLVLPYVLGLLWLRVDRPWAFGFPLLALPAALWLAHVVFWNEPGPRYNGYLAKASLLNLATGLLLAAGLRASG